jgi:hypothetical protein
LVIINVRSLYSTKATIGLKINRVTERILSGRGTQLAIRKKVAFLKARGIGVQYREKAKQELILLDQFSLPNCGP